MTALNKQALRELIREAGNRKIIVHAKTVSELLDELETKEEQRANWFQMAQKLGEDLEAAEKRIAELEARTVTLPTPYPKGYGLVSDKYNFALEECADAIRAAGIGVKGE
ncbi:ead/Ea22-like family protein [Citrobacter freundii]|uniref:ead/Ea22-like family protein n=1 Tax=Citrobacter freundii TaxID=546 RepID=UPI001F3DF9DE|nr:ead/Ea22-like family protein [Citrobacter freundii]